jgi:hypothetical protein
MIMPPLNNITPARLKPSASSRSRASSSVATELPRVVRYHYHGP